MSIYEKAIEERAKKCTDEIIDVFIKYEMKLEETDNIIYDVRERISPLHIPVSDITKLNGTK